MVAPLCAGERERRVVMPPGQWHDFWTGAPVMGEEIRVPHSEEKIPVFVKAGSLVPWAAVAPHSGSAAGRELTVRVYGDGSMGWSSGDSASALRLRWSAAQKRGEATGEKSGWRVTAWQQIG
jgi:alpha-D-xyloside xylohydrolase